MSTYVPLSTVALTSSASSVILSGIPQIYNDLILVCSYRDTRSQTYSYPKIQLNGDTGSNYSQTNLYGVGSSTALTNRQSSATSVQIYEGVGGSATSNIFSPLIIHFQSYSNTTTNKTFLIRGNNTSGASGSALAFQVALWRNTAAINSITIVGDTAIDAGSIFTLYGIGEGSPKAFGGDEVRTDGTYWYHIFRSSGVFSPTQALNVDYLVVAGGGGGRNGGGGAGGLRTSIGGSQLSLSNGLNYTVTVGAGGAAQTASPPTKGGDSVFGTISATGGGRASTGTASEANGGSGGGASDGAGQVGGTGNQGGYSPSEGNNGGGGVSGGAGGGGGHSSVGGTATSGVGGAGGSGTSSSITGSALTYAAGGGGGGSSTGGSGTAGVSGNGQGGAGAAPTAGTANRGGGGGGGWGSNGAAGGSGIVIVRYAV